MKRRIRQNPVACLAAALMSWALLVPGLARGTDKYAASGLVVQVDRTQRALVVSCDAIPGVMDPMVMSFAVRDSKDLDGLQPGAKITFTIVTGTDSSLAEGIHVVAFESLEPDPSEARDD